MSPNRLANETSPYLLQHADNPVDWYPWGEEALGAARERDVPILLSVGYAACHWCHVMAHESFEDPATAEQMNRDFVCIKVDREERPDIDGIYMDAVQAMTGRGGWPMTAFLTPAGEPFYAGTYYPNQPRHGTPSFTQVLEAIARTWRDERDRVGEQAARIVEAIGAASTAEAAAAGDPTETTLAEAARALREAFDPEWAGFGGAPKFPPSMTLEFLLRMHVRGMEGALDIVTQTLHAMADGGMHDQVGGGFHRYSVDRFWHVPHFEKMLYDNAQLARVYLHAWQITDDARFREVCERTLDYLLREMRHPDGGFYSSQDADTDGVEGATFTWSWDELVGLIGEDLATCLGAHPEGNWETTNVLWTPVAVEEMAKQLGIEPAELVRRLDKARLTLLAARDERPQPATDDKILTAWNAMAITALAEAGRILGRLDYVMAADRAGGFIKEALTTPDGDLRRSWRDGRADIPGFADDYGLWGTALLTLYEVTLDDGWFVRAHRLADRALELFDDPERGGFFQTAADAEPLVIRPKDLQDNAVPSGNSALAEFLVSMSLFTGERIYEDAARRALRLVTAPMARFPSGFGLALGVADSLLSSVPEIAIVGDLEEADPLFDVVWRRYLPLRILAAGEHPGDRVPLLADRSPIDGKPAAYVCERFVCQRPVTTPEDLAALLSSSR